MYFDPIIFTIGITGSITLIITALFLFRLFQNNPFPEIKNFIFACFILLLSPLSLVVVSLLSGNEFTTIRIIVDVIGLTGASIGAVILWYNLYTIQAQEFKSRHKLMIPVFFYCFGFLPWVVKWTWDTTTNQWIVNYDPIWSLFVTGVPALWITFELLLLSINNSLMKIEKPNLSSYLSILGFFFVFLSVIVILFERYYSPSSIIGFISTLSLGIFILVISFILDPKVLFVKESIGPKFLVISDRRSGNQIFDYYFNDKSNLESNLSNLFSGAMTGIIHLLGELIKREDIPPSVQYVDLHIIIEQKNGLIAYLVVDREVSLIRGSLRNILLRTSNTINGNITRPKRINPILHPIIEDELDFLI